MSKTDWISAYSTGADRAVQKFQAGGAMGPGPGGEAGAPQQGPDLEGMLMEYAQSRDPQLAVAVCDMLVEMMAAQQGGGAAPVAAPMGRRGMKLTKAPIFS